MDRLTYYTTSIVLAVFFAFGIGIAEANASYGAWLPLRGDPLTFVLAVGLWLLNSQIFFGWATVPICVALAALLERSFRPWLAKRFRSRLSINLAVCTAICGTFLMGVIVGLILARAGAKLPVV